MNSDGGIAQHGFRSRSSDNDLFVRAFNFVRKRGDSTELELLFRVVARDIDHCPSRQFLLVNLFGKMT